MLQLHPFSFGLFIWTKFVRDVSDERSNGYMCVAVAAAAAVDAAATAAVSVVVAAAAAVCIDAR